MKIAHRFYRWDQGRREKESAKRTAEPKAAMFSRFGSVVRFKDSISFSFPSDESLGYYQSSAYAGLPSPTVSRFLSSFDTGLKPGLNELPQFLAFVTKLQ